MVFVTRAVFPANFAGDAGLAGADEKCREAATKSVHPDVAGRSFVAWVSTSEDGGSPSARFVRRKDLYVLPGGTPVAEGWDGLVSGALKNPIDVDERGDGVQDVSSEKTVWTGTLQDGQGATDNCSSWTVADDVDGGIAGLIGQWTSKDSNWTAASSAKSCDKSRHLYCFER